MLMLRVKVKLNGGNSKEKTGNLLVIRRLIRTGLSKTSGKHSLTVRRVILKRLE
jgi:hypothetical protein